MFRMDVFGVARTAVGVFFLCIVFFTPRFSQAALDPARRAKLEAELSKIEKEIDVQKVLLSSKQKESVYLERDVAIITAQIDKAKLEIRARNIAIQKLTDDISSKTIMISDLTSKMEKDKLSLSELIRRTAELDNNSIVEIVLEDRDLSEVFADVDAFEFVGRELGSTLDRVSVTKVNTEEEKKSLEEKKAEQLELKGISELEKKRMEEREREKQNILKTSRGQEKEYQKMLSVREKDAAFIRAELFDLSGSAAIPFGKAVEYANYAKEKTGIRPAFLLGIIAEESNLGQNIGKGTWTVDMHPTRDRPVFESICRKLGLDPNLMPVSKKAWYGWGGAMGPAQFIPSTWVLYEERIESVLKESPANPWDPRHAFIASALLLVDNGAKYGNYASERLAALRYLAGWKNATKKAYSFYGDDVMGLADKYEREIAILQKN